MKRKDQDPNVRNTRMDPAASRSGGKRVENKDDLDSRTGEEQENKGSHVTHNRKGVKSDKKH
ncbi:hypothetical protein GCM10023093_02910 [Nemorincola caseinilytica]|uniref:Uncharacterized protein n=1 Tax=Nemorincola caseinilytica TaxID=2054315 RepID=A0ABP8N2W6_9BACT